MLLQLGLVFWLYRNFNAALAMVFSSCKTDKTFIVFRWLYLCIYSYNSMFYAGFFYGKCAAKMYTHAICLKSSMIGAFLTEKHTAILNSVEKVALMLLICYSVLSYTRRTNNKRVKYLSKLLHRTYRCIL